jgi:hypothetical protein
VLNVADVVAVVVVVSTCNSRNLVACFAISNTRRVNLSPAPQSLAPQLAHEQGHLLVFIFALQRHTRVKIFPETKPKVSHSSPKYGSTKFSGLDNTSQETNEKIQRIARRNFHLALVSTVSTFAAVGSVALVNSTTPALGEIGYETAIYLRDVTQIICGFDLPINSLACLLMTPQWQPRIVKYALALSGPTGMTPGAVDDESDVSTLGGS